MATHWQPGLIALHGNQTEVLADTVLAWLAAHPLDVLEPEVVLVQSNGMAEWFKMRMAEQLGICAAARVELPARFVWRSYRQVLGRQAVPRESPLDKTPMTWRLMRLLPQCLDDPVFAPIAGFLRPGEPERLLQLAQRLADLFDQYQIYRADWLDAWEAGGDVLPMPLRPGVPQGPVPDGQLWQPRLWRAVLAELDEEQRGTTRARLQGRVLEALQSGQAPVEPLARRVVVFGISQLPLSLLEFLAAIARHSQVLLAVPNPCRFHWADAIDGRELLRMARRRHPLRGGRDLAQLPLEAMHAHAHPLLAAWGRQSRDYVRQLDAFDTTGAAAHLQMPRVDLFDETDARDLHAAPLLVQVQQRIRDLVPLAEHPPLEVARADRSIVFHGAHSVVRELEVLHDQLLQMLAHPAQAGQRPLAPRDVVVMLPSIETAAPSIRAVFGQYGRHDPRHIPFDIADLGARTSSPLAVALQWLLRLPQQRCRLSELCDLLDVPAIAARMGLAAGDLPQLTRWMAGAGIRWGLNAPQRGALGLQACGEHNSAWFGLQRMLLGYASGAAQDGRDFGGIEPYDEVGGLSAELAGVLASLLERMLAWWREAERPATPDVWAQRFRALVQDFFKARGDEDETMLAALDAALTGWQRACEQAGYAAPLELAVAQEAWMQALEQPSLSQRFRAGGVTFCTLMPMRAIPFEVVCLLGMNDGDYPRRATRSDFDLMALPGQQRPGDRARRDDDRQLMLEALLSARRTLYISWTGHQVRDNSEQPPSVLVSQLRDYLAAGWCGEGGGGLLEQRTQQHPLQPFSRRYFEEGSPWTTYAREWRAAHAPSDAPSHMPQRPELPRAAFVPDASAPLTLARLIDFLRHPARAYLRQRLQVRFEQEDNPVVDEELFQLDGLTEYLLVQQLQQQLASDLTGAQQTPRSMEDGVRAAVARLSRSGRLPLAGLGERGARALQSSVMPSLRAWREQLALYAWPAPRRRLLIEQDGLVFDDWMDGLRQAGEPGTTCEGDDGLCWLLLEPRKLLTAKGQPRADRLLPFYLRSLALAASGTQARLHVVARDGLVQALPMDPREAQAGLRALMGLWRAGQDGPLPLPLRAGLAMAEDQPAAAQQAYEGGHLIGGECEDPSWARCYPDFEALCADGRFEALARAAHGPLLDWVAAQVQALPYGEDAA
ncbi:Exodeoxyribonuclease V gamma chain [Delftia tsuruhatensis]|uniref:exodeoxyribonuclease V subunit gamma n=1 Tax=Delftia tsuruhatensis TaxID=180282 RepID=UPI001E814F5C|nr:exodeoxyribonuclease V subunit gamma [Delftia tsuruhatensis]CAB5697861.1 Exodeoxyribonuclease V gamma chain [Delftia tsuruhatensis]CAC9676336.1 Exodeoxyribonuclease V gamma chain [Delftia tsuruhatensis]